MTYATEDIARTLKGAREAKGLSQRALSAKAGLTQTHIPKSRRRRRYPALKSDGTRTGA